MIYLIKTKKGLLSHIEKTISFRYMDTPYHLRGFTCESCGAKVNVMLYRRYEFRGANWHCRCGHATYIRKALATKESIYTTFPLDKYPLMFDTPDYGLSKKEVESIIIRKALMSNLEDL